MPQVGWPQLVGESRHQLDGYLTTESCVAALIDRAGAKWGNDSRGGLRFVALWNTVPIVDPTEELLATLQTYAQAYCAKDVDSLMALFSDDRHVSVIGTGQDELCAGREQVRELFERNFADATATRFEFGWTDVIVTGSAGVIAATLVIHLDVQGQRVRVPLRWTVVAVRSDDGWEWLHRHASSSAGDQSEGAAYPTGR